MSKQNRREFLKKSAATTLFSTFAISGTKASGDVLGANDRIRVAVAGINGRGRAHISGFASQKGVEVSHLVDPDTSIHESRSKLVKSKGGNTPTCEQDIRKVLENKDVDVISIATPNHWHSLMTIWGCQAGKDVYVEKPMSHNVFEGRQAVEAAKKYNRIVQHGTQQRSSSGTAREIAIIQSEKYGKLLVSKGYCCKPRWSIGSRTPTAPPKSLDFDLWLGPASEQPFHKNLVHYNWHWFWDFGNGDTGNQGVHEMDVARWAIKDATLPSKVWSLGGRYGYKDQGQTPNTQISVYEYGDVTLLFETRGLVNKHKSMPSIIRNEFYTSEGRISGGKFYPNKGGSPERISGNVNVHVTGGGAFGSFIHAVRSRKQEDVNVNAEEAHYSSALCHLGNASYRLGEAVPFNKKTQALGDNKQVVESFEKVKENLGVVGVDLQETTYQLGRTLEFDAKAERFVDDKEANALITRNYRKPYIVPEQV